MYGPAEFQRVCNAILDRLALDENDKEAFQILHSSEFVFTCAWMGLDADEVIRRISRIAATRREKRRRAG